MGGVVDLDRKLLEMELRRRLEQFRYESSTGSGQRGLMAHHIDALIRDLLPFIESKLRKVQQSK